MAKRHHPVMVFHFLKEGWFMLISRVLLYCKENGLNEYYNGKIFFLIFFILMFVKVNLCVIFAPAMKNNWSMV